ncbi:MAG: RDD family protein [Marinagarivorans sp.]|nr:RDD family protein [Marinagarivorans sp.]
MTRNSTSSNSSMPEHVNTIRIASAPLWRRFAALVYDSLILLAISMAYGALVTLTGALNGQAQSEKYQPMFHAGGIAELVLIGWISCLVFFYVGFWHRSGQTLGMRAWRLKLIDAHNSDTKVSISRCLQRAAWGVPSLVFLGLGYGYRFISPTKQCLHDQLTRTQVIVIPK